MPSVKASLEEGCGNFKIYQREQKQKITSKAKNFQVSIFFMSHFSCMSSNCVARWMKNNYKYLLKIISPPSKYLSFIFYLPGYAVAAQEENWSMKKMRTPKIGFSTLELKFQICRISRTKFHRFYRFTDLVKEKNTQLFKENVISQSSLMMNIFMLNMPFS